MRYKLINEPDDRLKPIEQILFNRGIPVEEVEHYLNTTDKDIEEPECLGENNLKIALSYIAKAIEENKKVAIIVDADCDGYTSAALFLNYFYDIFPTFVKNNIEYFLHENKAHGLEDCLDWLLKNKFDLVIVPDAGSNNYKEHEILKNNNCQVVILDHHLAEKISKDAIVINNQLSSTYKNKELSGAGVVYQFCRYVDKKLNINNAINYIDLAAIGNCGDMMSLLSIETKHLITEGFKTENLKNPFIYGMFEKNSFSIGKELTPIGAAFYIVPLINSMVRSGTLEEQRLLFESMLKYKAFDIILSNKRGHKQGETEKLIEQSLRTATNVKNRQTRVQDSCMEKLEKDIIENNMLEKNKVLLFLLEAGEIDSNIAGLAANKLMAKYQRPVCILTKVVENNAEVAPWEDSDQGLKIYYRGSARGYSKSGIEDFRQICLDTKEIEYAEGHSNAFGLSIPAENIDNFLEKTNESLKNLEEEPLYYLDYIYNGVDIDNSQILEIGNFKNIWGQDLEEPYILIKDLKISKDMVTIYQKKNLTLKVTLPNNLSIMLFDAPEELCNKLQNENEGYISYDIIGRCNVNEWNGMTTPQIFIVEMQENEKSSWLF